MNISTVKKLLRDKGFEGKVIGRKAHEFGTHDGSGPAIHRRILDDIEYDVDEIMYSVERDGFETVVCYLEPKSYYYYINILNDQKHTWTEGEINGLRKQLGYCSNWSKVAREELVEDISRNGMYDCKITREQTKFGLDWLKRKQFRLDGRIRAGAFIGEREAKIIRSFKKFEFVGLDFMSINPYTGAPQAVAPLYRCVAKNGESFTYRVSPMLFGSQYEVVS